MDSSKEYKLFTSGKSLEASKGVMIMIHGRGGTAENILTLADEIDNPDFHYIAPQATGNSWYPYSFLAPIPQNEPGISSGIKLIGNLIKHIMENNIGTGKIFLLGFSQGACLTLEFASRNAGRYGGIFGLSGGLIGPENTPRKYSGTFDDTPVLLGCSDIDPHIPLQRVHKSKEVFEEMNAKVTERIYSGMPHTIIQDEIDFVKKVMESVNNSK